MLASARLVGLALATGAALSAAADPDPDTSPLRGKADLQANSPTAAKALLAKDIHVYVATQNGAEHGQAATDANGKYEVGKLKNGKPYIAVYTYTDEYLPRQIDILQKNADKKVDVTLPRLDRLPQDGSAVAAAKKDVSGILALLPADAAIRPVVRRVLAKLTALVAVRRPEGEGRKLEFAGIEWETRSSGGKNDHPGPLVYRHDLPRVRPAGGGADDAPGLQLAVVTAGDTTYGSNVFFDSARPRGRGEYRVDLAPPRDLAAGAWVGVGLFPAGGGGGSSPYVDLQRLTDGKGMWLKCQFAMKLDPKAGECEKKTVKVAAAGKPVRVRIDWQADRVKFDLLQRDERDKEGVLFTWECKAQALVPAADAPLVLHLQVWADKPKEPLLAIVEVTHVSAPGK